VAPEAIQKAKLVLLHIIGISSAQSISLAFHRASPFSIFSALVENRISLHSQAVRDQLPSSNFHVGPGPPGQTDASAIAFPLFQQESNTH